MRFQNLKSPCFRIVRQSHRVVIYNPRCRCVSCVPDQASGLGEYSLHGGSECGNDDPTQLGSKQIQTILTVRPRGTTTSYDRYRWIVMIIDRIKRGYNVHYFAFPTTVLNSFLPPLISGNQSSGPGPSIHTLLLILLQRTRNHRDFTRDPSLQFSCGISLKLRRDHATTWCSYFQQIK